MRRDDESLAGADRLRLLERWLPLAHAASARYGWRLDAAGLAALVIAAEPGLDRSRSALEAYAILWGAYTRTTRDEPTP